MGHPTNASLLSPEEMHGTDPLSVEESLSATLSVSFWLFDPPGAP